MEISQLIKFPEKALVPWPTLLEGIENQFSTRKNQKFL